MRRDLFAGLFAALLCVTPAAAQTGGPDGGRVTTPDPDTVDPGRFLPRANDSAYGAYQRGYYITSLNLATPLALQGDPAAQTLIAEIYSRGLGVARDIEKATEWYEKAADQKVPEALFQLAMILVDGGEEFGDRARSLRLMQEAADAGHRLAQFNLAQMLLASGSQTDLSRAATYYEQAANAGLADAQYAMAQIREHGFGGRTVDLAASRRWLERAARQNFDTAQIQLGTWLVDGIGGERDYVAGFNWLMRAASAGNAAAQNRVAKLYRAGIGVEPDTVSAMAWYLRARRAGLVDPIMEDQLAGLSDEQIAEAGKRAETLR